MAPVILALKDRNVPFDFVLTGQHQETIDELINGFGLPLPNYFLTSIGEADSPKKLSGWLARVMLQNLKPSSIIASKRYDFCLVHGDTLSTLVGALLAKRHGIKVAHIEAGLRTHSIFHPFPEELTRIVVSKISDVFYCSGDDAISNIGKIKRNADIVNIGQNTLLDSVRVAVSSSEQHAEQENYCVASIHRFENISNEKRLDFIVGQLSKISQTVKVKFVLHSATRIKLEKSGHLSKLIKNPKFELLPRMSYFNFISLLRNSCFLVSDGGSNQEECSYLNIPCLLMRQKTERSEGLGENVILSEYDPAVIDRFTENYLKREEPLKRGLNNFSEEPSKLIAEDLALRIKGGQVQQ